MHAQHIPNSYGYRLYSVGAKDPTTLSPSQVLFRSKLDMPASACAHGASMRPSSHGPDKLPSLSDGIARPMADFTDRSMCISGWLMQRNMLNDVWERKWFIGVDHHTMLYYDKPAVRDEGKVLDSLSLISRRFHGPLLCFLAASSKAN